MKQINKMKHTKRWIAVLLCFMLVMTGPIGAFANVTTGSGIGYENSGNSTTGSGLQMGDSNNHKHNSSTSGSSLGLTMQKEKSSDVTTVGSLIWIKSGSNVYKSMEATNATDVWTLLGNYQVKIVDIINGEDNKPAWYEFAFTTIGLGEKFLKNFKYVKAEDTSITEPEKDNETDTNVKFSGLPDGVTPTVVKVVPREMSQDVFEKIGSHKLVFALDITLHDENGDEWQPSNGNPVTVTLDADDLGLKNGDEIAILHEHDDVDELGTCTVTDGKLTFTTGSFSTFYGYTVDFEYDGTWYSIGGGSSMYLYELFSMLGIERAVKDVTDVTFSNPDLLTAEKVVSDGYTGETTWLLRSLKAFDTQEELTISFNDSTTLTINVYDAQYSTLSSDITLNDGDKLGYLNNPATVSGAVTITLNGGTVKIGNQITIPNGASLTIKGSGTLSRAYDQLCYGDLFHVESGGKLIIEGTNAENGIIIDGGAVWSSTDVQNSTRKLLTVTKGNEVSGSAIYVENGTLDLKNLTIQNVYTKYVSSGGQAPAIHSKADKTENKTKCATITMNNVTVKNCATNSDHAIVNLNTSITTMTDCNFKDNCSVQRYASIVKAGGPDQFCQLTMTNCTASGNYSSGWGGVLLWAANDKCNDEISKAIIDGCTFKENTARYLGGAISNEAIMEVKKTIIKNNTAMAGGGVASFPFTRTQAGDEEKYGNACGLTLGTGNVIENNTAYAADEFTPFSKGGNGADEDEPDSVLGSGVGNELHTYAGGGGGIWCFMNKDNWTYSLDVGTGNIIQRNKAKNAGGGVYIEQQAGTATNLTVSGAKILSNTAVNGGGIATKDATVTVNTGSISKNEANNGGGIYVISGTLNVTGGMITENRANAVNDEDKTVDKVVTKKTAINQDYGVGGGIYVKKGTFSLTGDKVGIYGNMADFAADDVYASGDNTTLTIPNVQGMQLTGDYASADDWYIDYVSNDSNYSKSDFSWENEGRYRTNNNKDHAVQSDIKSGTAYYCLTLGYSSPSLVITKVVNEDPENAFLFEVTAPENQKFIVTIPTSAFTKNNEGKWVASVTINKLKTGQYSVVELTDWSWRYAYQSSEVKNAATSTAIDKGIQFTMNSDGEEVTFTNKREEDKWLSGDCFAKNWWSKEGLVDLFKKQKEIVPPLDNNNGAMADSASMK